jgi:hypothetical protein
VKTNSGDLDNRTDVFIGIGGEGGDTSTDGHVEVNTNPQPLAERVKARRWRGQLHRE